MKKGIFIIEENDAVRSMLKQIILDESDLKIVGEAATGIGGKVLLRQSHADLVILGSSITDIDVVSAITKIREACPETKIILFVDAVSEDIIIAASEAGADDFASKPVKKAQLLRMAYSL